MSEFRKPATLFVLAAFSLGLFLVGQPKEGGAMVMFFAIYLLLA